MSVRRRSVAAFAAAVAALFLGWLLLSPSALPPRAMFIGGNHSRTVMNDTAIRALLDQYRQPDELWVFGAKVLPNGTIREENFTGFAANVHRVAPRTKVVLALGLDPRSTLINDSTLRTRLFSAIQAHVIDQQYDGLFLDFEPLPNGDPIYPILLDGLRAFLPNTLLGVYAFRLADNGTGYLWTDAYLKTVSEHADFLMPALYNTGGMLKTIAYPASVAQYQEWVRNQTARVDALGIDDKIYWGLPAYRPGAYHRVAVENIGNAGPLLLGRKTVVYSGHYMTEGDYAMYDDFIELQQSLRAPP